MNAIGIDIGTTTISVSAIDGSSGLTVKSLTVNNDSFITSDKAFEKIQSVSKIEAHVLSLLKSIMSEYENISCIGVTGQMHGIVYIDAQGNACSPLYTWQDDRANQNTGNGTTYCEKITEKTGYKVAAGYGLATHYYNTANRLVPENAVSFCTIHDYIVMRLCKNKKPLLHISDAASLGLFDIAAASFDRKAIAELRLSLDMLPDVTADEVSAGRYNGIPVAVAIGDNQASFIGSVRDCENTVLINIGTGSQISVIGQNGTPFPSGEVRPLTGKNCLLVGSALCGGRVYACLESFFRSVLSANDVECDSAYAYMDTVAKQCYPLENELIVDTSLSGKRNDPDVRGKVENICIDNFTPAHLICGVLKGSVRELYDMYTEIYPSLKTKPTKLVGSGNGLRKSPVWRQMTEEMFGMKLSVPAHKEEAAYGAAIFALAACGIYESIVDAQKIIKYI